MILYAMGFALCFLRNTSDPDLPTAIDKAHDFFVQQGFSISRNEFGRLLVFATPITIVFEEVFFRLPLLLAVRRWDTTRPLFVTLVLLSALFGFLHGGLLNIFTQGVLGLFLGILFLKAGGINRNRGKAFGASLTAHLCYDFVMIAGALHFNW